MLLWRRTPHVGLHSSKEVIDVESTYNNSYTEIVQDFLTDPTDRDPSRQKNQNTSVNEMQKIAPHPEGHNVATNPEVCSHCK